MELTQGWSTVVPPEIAERHELRETRHAAAVRGWASADGERDRSAEPAPLMLTDELVP